MNPNLCLDFHIKGSQAFDENVICIDFVDLQICITTCCHEQTYDQPRKMLCGLNVSFFIMVVQTAPAVGGQRTIRLYPEASGTLWYLSGHSCVQAIREHLNSTSSQMQKASSHRITHYPRGRDSTTLFILYPCGRLIGYKCK